MIPRYRVWCKNQNEWEKDTCYIHQDGILYQRTRGSERLIPILEKNHVVMLSTGFHDAKGIEIFVGDIVIHTQKSINYGDVYHNDYAEVFQQQNGAYRIRGKHIYEMDAFCNRKRLEVVGNIFENAELLDHDSFMTEK